MTRATARTGGPTDRPMTHRTGRLTISPAMLTRTFLVSLVLTVLAALLLAGCSGTSTSAGSDSQAEPMQAGEAGVAAPAPAATGADGSAAKAGPDSSLADDAAEPRSVIRTGRLTLRVDKLDPASASTRQVATGLGGYVASETTGLSEGVTTDGSTGPSGSASTFDGSSAQAGQSLIQLRVPQPSFDAAMAALARIGTELNRTTSARDVTADQADLTSRSQSAAASVARVRALLGQAKTIQDIVTLEAELTRRQADLDAYQAKLKALTGQADLATITVELVTPAVAASGEQNGFLGGLAAGWHSLGRATAALLVVLGALLPYLVLFALIGAAVLWTRRRFGWGRRPAQAPAAPAAGPAGSTPNSTPDSTDGRTPATTP